MIAAWAQRVKFCFRVGAHRFSLGGTGVLSVTFSLPQSYGLRLAIVGKSTDPPVGARNMSHRVSAEAEFIQWLRRRFTAGAGVRTWIGDDCAVVAAPAGGEWVVTTDMLLEGTHFDLATASARDVGRKAMNVNVSDVAAMGCRPRFALTAVGVSRRHGGRVLRELYAGLAMAARRAGVVLIGGDTNSHAGGLVIAVTLLGEVPRGGRPFLRSAARPGDAVCVTGALGGSILGRHLRFEPRVATALALRRRVTVHAMIDVSDGLSVDLGHVLEESGVGAEIESARVPIAAAARRRAAVSGREPLAHALHDGEDFELLFTLPAEQAERLHGRRIGGARVSRIGRVLRGGGAWLRAPDGARTRLRPEGYQHGF